MKPLSTLLIGAGMLLLSGNLLQAETKEVVIEGNDQMKYSVTKFEVAAGATVKLTLKHTGKMPANAMGHNVVLLKKGTDINAFSQAGMTAADSDYIAKDMADKVIAKTKILGGGESDTIEFTAPAEAGEYTYICTFPGHLMVGMKGVMVVK